MSREPYVQVPVEMRDRAIVRLRAMCKDAWQILDDSSPMSRSTHGVHMHQAAATLEVDLLRLRERATRNERRARRRRGVERAGGGDEEAARR